MIWYAVYLGDKVDRSSRLMVRNLLARRSTFAPSWHNPLCSPHCTSISCISQVPVVTTQSLPADDSGFFTVPLPTLTVCLALAPETGAFAQ